MSFVRRVRGAIGNGLVWAGAWMLGKLAVLVIAILDPGIGLPLWPTVPLVLTSAAATGFINGLLFSAAFALYNRSRSLEEIRPLRTGILGLGAGAVVPTIQFAVLVAAGFAVPPSAIAFGLLVGGVLGCATAVGSLRLAQSARPSALAPRS